MNICCLLFLLIVANYVGRVLYANNVGQLLYVVFAPSGGVSTTDGLHRPGISKTRLLILIFIVICYFWRFNCFVWFDACALPRPEEGRNTAPGGVVVVMRYHKAHLLFVPNPFF